LQRCIKIQNKYDVKSSLTSINIRLQFSHFGLWWCCNII